MDDSLAKVVREASKGLERERAKHVVEIITPIATDAERLSVETKLLAKQLHRIISHYSSIAGITAEAEDASAKGKKAPAGD